MLSCKSKKTARHGIGGFLSIPPSNDNLLNEKMKKCSINMNHEKCNRTTENFTRDAVVGNDYSELVGEIESCNEREVDELLQSKRLTNEYTGAGYKRKCKCRKGCKGQCGKRNKPKKKMPGKSNKGKNKGKGSKKSKLGKTLNFLGKKYKKNFARDVFASL